MKVAKMTVETSDGLTYVFPKVELTVTANIDGGNQIRNGWLTYTEPSSVNSMKITGYAFRGKDEDYIMTMTKEVKVSNFTIPELYADDLTKIKLAMKCLDGVAQSGVFSCEIRVKTDDVDTWVVIGYGMDGAPAILRFESDK